MRLDSGRWLWPPEHTHRHPIPERTTAASSQRDYHAEPRQWRRVTASCDRRSACGRAVCGPCEGQTRTHDGAIPAGSQAGCARKAHRKRLHALMQRCPRAIGTRRRASRPGTGARVAPPRTLLVPRRRPPPGGALKIVHGCVGDLAGPVYVVRTTWGPGTVERSLSRTTRQLRASAPEAPSITMQVRSWRLRSKVAESRTSVRGATEPTHSERMH